MTERKKSFVMFVDYQSDFEELTGDECKEVMNLIFNYEKTGELPEIKDRFVKLVFGRIKRDLDRNDKAWAERKEILSEAGKKGAEKRWNKESSITSDSHPITDDSHPIKPIASMAVNVNVNDNVNVSEEISTKYKSLLQNSSQSFDEIMENLHKQSDELINTEYEEMNKEQLPF